MSRECSPNRPQLTSGLKPASLVCLERQLSVEISAEARNAMQAGVWLDAKETKISVALWTSWLGMGVTFYDYQYVHFCNSRDMRITICERS